MGRRRPLAGKERGRARGAGLRGDRRGREGGDGGRRRGCGREGERRGSDGAKNGRSGGGWGGFGVAGLEERGRRGAEAQSPVIACNAVNGQPMRGGHDAHAPLTRPHVLSVFLRLRILSCFPVWVSVDCSKKNTNMEVFLFLMKIRMVTSYWYGNNYNMMILITNTIEKMIRVIIVIVILKLTWQFCIYARDD